MSGADSPLVKKVLAGKSPRNAPAELVRGTLLKDVAEAQEDRCGGDEGHRRFARPDDRARPVGRRSFAPCGRRSRRRSRSRCGRRTPRSPRPASLSRMNLYPDATFTLRLAFGAVKGYEELGKQIPPWTTFAGLYQRAAEHDNQPPFHLPERWAKCEEPAGHETPFNFVCTADIIGGNSGSPVVNRNGELVGIIFDGNIQSLVLDFIYTEDQSRALAVHSSAIREALRSSRARR